MLTNLFKRRATTQILRRGFGTTRKDFDPWQGPFPRYVDGGDNNEVGVVNTSPNQVGDYYKYIYRHGVDPEFFQGVDFHAGNSYTEAPFYEWDNFLFEYKGQWWDHGNIYTTLRWLTVITVLFASVYQANVSRFLGFS